jgi:hypothetical protein
VARRVGYDPEPWPPNDAVAAEFSDFVEAHRDVEALYGGVAKRFTRCTGDDVAGSELADAIDSLVIQERAGSFARLGDGEGSLLALGSNRHPELAEYCARNRSLKHFGDPNVLVDNAGTLVPAFEKALGSATVLGIPGPLAFAVTLEGEVHADRVGGAFGIGTVYDYLEGTESLRLETKECWSSSFHLRLLPHYRALVHGREIGLVSCHRELPGALRERMGAEQVHFHAVPEQAHLSHARRDTGHYPDRYRSLLAELDNVRPGTLYLVAAGMLSKIYCDVVRGAGGVAVDIGSVADLWAGVRSRMMFSNEELERWRIVIR